MGKLTWEQAVTSLREQPDQAALVRACYYDDPLLEAATRFADSQEWLAVKALLPGTRGRALDLGAGRGISSFALARDGWAVSALEPDAGELVGAVAIRQLAVESALSIVVIRGLGESLPFRDASFDLVYGRQVLHHARDLYALCREVVRVLRPGGVFLPTREHVISRREDLGRFLEGHPLHRYTGGEHAYLLEEYLSALRAAGLTVERALNPFESDINLSPDTVLSVKTMLARRCHLPWPWLIPDGILSWLGSRSCEPGRLYTFVGRLHAH
jgi:SAM-dependent methyltransferase